MLRAFAPAKPAHVSMKVDRHYPLTSSPAPADGDIVVEQQAADGGATVRRFPGAPQFSCSSRAAALSFASGFAERQRVGMWEKRGDVFTPISPVVHGRERR